MSHLLGVNARIREHAIVDPSKKTLRFLRGRRLGWAALVRESPQQRRKGRSM
jgi:hypothetical protein